ncbi:uncharacterized protein LOC115879823 [Sitophilus oryzae]|uniref:Uncharacterized protein LOC115879823 n=1 Tax=Sitophilus oryzae TaxID=7048 RepID=A0A6J2XNQ0_SITOR|nr:uncharacterized protein LOC115879823 [Sitophilus oryzae]
MQFAVLTVLLATLLQTTLSQNATSSSVSVPPTSTGPSSVSGLSSTIPQESHPAAPTASEVQNDEPKAELTTGVPEAPPTRVPVSKVPSTQPPLVHAETTMKVNATKGGSVPQQKGGKNGSSRIIFKNDD